MPRREGDPAWTLTVDGVDPERERVTGSLLTLADGAIGARGSPAWQHAAATPRVLAAGLYRGSGADQELAPLPRWNLFVDGLAPERSSRTLDLRAGLLHHELRLGEDAGEAIAFSSLATPGVAVARVALPRGARLGPRLVAPPELTVRDAGNTSRAAWMEIGFDEGGLAVGAVERSLAQSGRVADRVVAYVGDPLRAPGRREALGRARRAAASGFEALLAEHRARWGARWHAADVAVRGDDELTFATRFALFHLMASVPSSGDAALGARGLSGDAYRGHVFWDADVYVLPFLAATHPAAARALLEYRVRRLPAARERARREGRAGARFPWESAHDGRDVTPTQAVDRTGETVRIRTGALEEHVTAGVAWAASHYVEWSGDKTFARGPGRDLLVETARYWASRAELAPDGHAHIRGVTGPDEYHECVDDDAYTNVMARWNLRAAATAAGGAPAERTRWRTLADALVDGYDPATGLYEQFAGFSSLEPLVIAELAPRRPIAADLLLGRERVAGAQVVKQADVLMAHLLVPDEVAHGSLQANLAHYEPRTAHGSSLSPGVHAALLARARRLDEAVALLRLASRIDLDDLTGTTAGGLHMAAMGSVWLALAHGFAGLRARGGTLELDPALPPSWDGLDLRVTHRGATLSLELRHGAIRLEAARNVCVRVGKGRVRHVKGACRLVERSGRWHEVRP